MSKQYDRLRNPLAETRKQDMMALGDHLWRLQLVLDRVQTIGKRRRSLKKGISMARKRVDTLASCFRQWREGYPNDSKKIQLRTLQSAMYQLEDMADDIECNFDIKRQQATYLTRWLGQATSDLRRQKFRETAELLRDLHEIIEGVRTEFELEAVSTTVHHAPGLSPVEEEDTDYTAYQISEGKSLCEISEEKTFHNKYSQGNGGAHLEAEFDGRHNYKSQLLERLFKQGGDLVVPYEISQVKGKATIPVQDIFSDKRVRENFGLLLCVHALATPMSTLSRPLTLTESILKILNSAFVNLEGASHAQRCGKSRCCSSGTIHDDGLPKKQVISSSDWSQGEEMDELQTLFQHKLMQCSKGKQKFLLVLEDVLEDQLPGLHHLLSALLGGNSESRIVISSQSSEILQSLHGVRIANDGAIQHNIFWYFFRSFAFRDAKPNEYNMVEHMGKEMAAYLQKFPLAAKMIAKMLNRKLDYQFWYAILGKLRHVEKTAECEHHHLLSLLKICYDELPAPLRLCFQYCSLFPNNWTFRSDNLVQLWMSQGFLIEQRQSNSAPDKVKSVDDVGKCYFDDLCSRSFFEKLKDDGNNCFYRMHPSIQCFAQFIAGEEFMRIESDIPPEKSLHATHLSVRSTNLSALHNVDAVPRLRTLIIFGPMSSDASQILEHILPKLRKTRTLDLAGCGMKKFPVLSNDMRKHLRYLSIYDTGIDELPDDLCDFFHLQVLNVQGSRLQKLPQKMTKLCNLRHISGPTFLTSEMRQLGKLKGLQELEEFAVSKKHKIQELGGIEDLRGSISITNLERVKSKHAAKARLQYKRNLNSLKLEWSSMVTGGSLLCGHNRLMAKTRKSAKVLERLKPHSALHVLEINGYLGMKSPTWFTAEVLENIVDITLRHCHNWDEPPSFGQLPHLKILKLENWNKLRTLSDQGFPKLDELCLEGMPQLLVWKDCHNSFPCLKLLTIRNCPNLRTIPLLKSSALAEIYVEEVGLEGLPLRTIDEMADCKKPESLTRLTVQACHNLLDVGGNHAAAAAYLPSSLLHLRVTACENIKHIRLKAPVSLQELHIEGCKLLTVLTAKNVEGDLPSVRAVHVDNISLLGRHYARLVCLEELTIQGGFSDSLDKLPKSLLKKLCLINCQEEALPMDMQQFSSLKSLQLKQCHEMESLPYLPYNLDELRIDECPRLEKQCREDGPGWSNISHVPHKYI